MDRALKKKASLFGRELWVARYIEQADHWTNKGIVLSPVGEDGWRDCRGFHLNIHRWNLIVCIWKGDN